MPEDDIKHFIIRLNLPELSHVPKPCYEESNRTLRSVARHVLDYWCSVEPTLIRKLLRVDSNKSTVFLAIILFNKSSPKSLPLTAENALT